jgi:acyl carrier protein
MGADIMTMKDTAMAVISKVSGKQLSEITSEAELVANLGLDSAKALELLVELEDQLEIEISDEDAAKLNTVGDILDHIDGLAVS